MSKKNLEERKRNNYHLKIIFSVLIMVLAFLAELYIMIIRQGDPIYLVVFGIVFLLFSYVLMNSIMQIQYMQARIEKEDHEGLLKSEKASYLIVKKSFEEIFKRLDSLEKGIQLPTEELLTAQKAIAKVNISRSKENTDALMNSNDKLLEKVFEFEDYLSNNNQRIDDQNRMIEQQIQEIILKQQELSSALKEVQLNLKNEILQAVNTVTTTQAQAIIQQPVQMAQPMDNTPVIENTVTEVSEEPVIEESVTEEPLITEEPIIEEEPLIPEEPAIEEEAIEEPMIEEAAEEVPPMPDMSDPNKMMSPEDIAALLANVTEEETPVAEEEAVEEEELIPEEPIIEEEPLIPEEPAIEEEVIEEPIIEEAVEEVPPMPDMSDPNKMMSPEDIAALIANVSTEEEPVAAEEPVVQVEEIEEEPEEEEIMIPDMSDPNKMMSPEEIAALIANL